ncbi:uncharacterized protein LOC105175546 [Sesamum indicum]|uniref:Uncharacterized protein LOC105175546 n=1 Tax=Sesamum indicum TaxID=4182 RepID=A0A6I9UDT6_SESIN|nr:uncharacterized protein LOC105175546 [Sesamum indicum]XP_011096326.1 uncharacterized protein LOC105175546 [Sesamum indicum]XP_011096332.1 uncharacterized protein LOC105175546 [Sesamum indicum]XP_011096348.1 uncharacterized protein LOC105175546 [Sesamum indicum]XP_020547570.1 uncharacterized protein LOC105175546 [Sesamum indicum]XP_020547571.1 uncharacterized protein LOC105175546 [Sesamum indicum]XP_020547572.1 uncharacterized protein LOC105175546 [Sesamum indicum]XP_020547573.1 uncharacte
MADRKAATSQANLFPESKEIKYYATQDCTGGNHVGNMKQEISTSRVSGEQVSESVSTGKKQGSTLVFEGNSKYHDPDMQSSGAIASTWTTPVKSDISTEVSLPLGHGSFEMEARKKHHGNAAEDSLHALTHDSQHRTESSCSNSFSVVLPFSLSNNSCQDISKEAYSSWNYVSSMDSSNSKAFDRRSEEPVTASYESGVSGQIARKAIRNARARNSMMISSIVGSQSSLPFKKGDEEISREWRHAAAKREDGVEVLKQPDMYKWVSGNTSSIEEEHAGTVEKSSICSGNSDNFNCSSKTVENIRSCDEHDNLQTTYSGERLINSGTSEESENILAIKGKPVKMSPEMMGKFKGDSWANESSESSIMKYSEVAAKDQGTFIAGFDLNEEINANGTEDFIQPVVTTISSHRVIHVVAKAGRPSGQPTVPLKFEGRLGWKGSAETSAFLPAVHSKCLDRKTCSRNNEPKAPQGFTGIDLNIAALEDSAPNGMPMEHEGILQDSQSEVDSKRSKNLWIDLNCLYDAADEFTQPSLLPVSENHHVEDLNLNVTTSEGYRSYNLQRLGKGLQSLGNKTSDSANPGRRDFNFTSHCQLVDLSSMQHVPQNAYAAVASPDILQPEEMMQRVASLQPKLPFISHTLPPHSYPSKGPFPFGPVDPLPSSIHISGTMPYPRYPHEHGVLPEVFNPGTAHMSLRTPHFLQVVHGQGTGSNTASTHKLDLKTEENLLSTKGTKMDEARQFLFLAKNSSMDEHLHPEAWSSGSMKRKEPEGGLEFYQLGHKQVN